MIPDGLEIYNSPIGEIEIASLNDMLISCTFSKLYHFDNLQSNSITQEGARQLNEYFSGQLKKFDLPLDFTGTELQIKVMRILETIPFGETKNYGEIASMLSLPSGSRAIGNLIGKNPLLILIPCHRVLGKNGKLTGYAGGSDRKRWLLRHEMDNSYHADRLF